MSGNDTAKGELTSDSMRRALVAMRAENDALIHRSADLCNQLTKAKAEVERLEWVVKKYPKDKTGRTIVPGDVVWPDWDLPDGDEEGGVVFMGVRDKATGEVMIEGDGLKWDGVEIRNSAAPKPPQEQGEDGDEVISLRRQLIAKKAEVNEVRKQRNKYKLALMDILPILDGGGINYGQMLDQIDVMIHATIDKTAAAQEPK